MNRCYHRIANMKYQVVIQNFAGGEVQGTILHCYLATPIYFKSSLSFLAHLEHEMHRLDYPQPTTNHRFFF